MKAIDVKEQPILSFGRTVKITANGIRYRLFRSLVTVVVVAVAVAFLVNILSESLVKRSIGQRTQDRVAELRCAAAWSGRLTSPGTFEDVLMRVAGAERGDAAWREAATMGGFTEGEMARCHKAAKHAAAYLAFFDRLDYAHRRALVHRGKGIEIFDRLGEEAGWHRFERALAAMRSVRFVSSLDAFQAFLKQWTTLRAQLARLREGHRKAVAAVAEVLAGRPAIEALADADGAFGRSVRELGFALEPREARRVADQARRMLDMRRLERSIAAPPIRQAVAARLDLLPADVNVRTLWRLLRDRRSAAWYLAKQKELGGEVAGFEVDGAVALARLEAETRALTRAERIAGAPGGVLGIGERMSWLVLASMLVCTVGISNAMLMSVTERFREIATLKCLGALDGFIMLMFVLEACFLGVVGGLLGAVLGFALGMGRMLVAFGSLVGAAFPAGPMAVAVGISVVLGVVLAAVASVYPAFKAARLAPMEAMRIQ